VVVTGAVEDGGDRGDHDNCNNQPRYGLGRVILISILHGILLGWRSHQTRDHPYVLDVSELFELDASDIEPRLVCGAYGSGGLKSDRHQ